MWSLAIASLRSQARRFVAPGLAIFIAVAFVAATLSLSSTLLESSRRAAVGNIASYAVIVTPAPDRPQAVLDSAARDRVAALPGVERVVGVRNGLARLEIGVSHPFVLVGAIPDSTSMRVISGRMPTQAGEVALGSAVAEEYHLTVGTRVTAQSMDGPAVKPLTVTVAGIVDTRADPRYPSWGSSWAFLVDSDVVALAGSDRFTELDVVSRPGVATEALRARVEAALGPHANVITGAAAAAAAAERQTGTRELTAMLLAFAGVSLFVSALVIANTFTILLARKARETALLRLVGATSTQLTRAHLVEAVLVGLLFSGLGVLGGVGFTVLVARLASGRPELHLDQVTVHPADVVVPFALGMLVTLAASVLPVVQASRIAPMSALRPAAEIRANSRVGWARGIAALALVLLGAGLLVQGASQGDVQAGIAGGMSSFLGILVAGPLVMPVMVRVAGALPARLAGMPTRLAVENSVRNRRRTAATMSALLVGVTLIVMMSVGVETARTSAETAINDHYAVDLTVSTEEPMPTALISGVQHASGISATATARSALVTYPTGETGRVVGIPGDATSVTRSGRPLLDVQPGTLVVSGTNAAAHALEAGSRVTLRGPTGSQVFTVRIGDDLGMPALATAADIARLDTAAPVTVLLAKVSDTADLAKVMGELNSLVSSTAPGTAIDGSAPLRLQFRQVLDIILWIVTGLLGISVLIAVVGIANTLSLSVLERTQESGLLRALGLTRGQLRWMLAAEAMLLAVAATLFGMLLGTAYAMAGVSSVLLGSGVDPALAIPWGRLAVIAGCAVLAGLLASLLPARRAARVSPTAVLAID